MYFAAFTLTFIIGLLNCAVGSNQNFTNGSNITNTKQIEKSVQTDFSNDTVVSEIQSTICSVKTRQIIAKAQSTASRVLIGVCKSEDMIRAFKNLETIIIQRLEKLQQNLINVIESKLQFTEPKKYNKKPSAFKAIDYIFDENLFKNYT